MIIEWLAFRLIIGAVSAGQVGGVGAAPPGQPVPHTDAAPVAVGVASPGYLWPENFQVENDQARVFWRSGTAEAPWPGARITHAFVRGLGTQENMDSVESPGGRSAGFTLEGSGAFVIGVTLGEVEAVVRPADVARIGEDGARGIDADERARVVQCAKAVLRREDAASPGRRSPVVTSKCGQPAELRPLMDPTVGPIPRDIPVRVFAGGSARAGASVSFRVMNAAGEVTHEGVAATSAEGVMTLTIDRPGVWVLASEWVVPGDGEGGAVWYQSTLSFEVAP
ncbi:MAG: hypothetical protein AMXMBFR58_03470 [Phycisphaerae bacterium]